MTDTNVDYRPWCSKGHGLMAQGANGWYCEECEEDQVKEPQTFDELCHREIVKIRELTLKDDDYTGGLLGEAVGSPTGVTMCVEARMKQIVDLQKLCLRAASSIDLLMIDVDDIPIVDDLRKAAKALQATTTDGSASAASADDFAQGFADGVNEALTNKKAEDGSAS